MKPIIKSLLLISFLLVVSFSFGQKSTEMYIPLGQSPGLSGTRTVMGTVEAYDSQGPSLTVRTERGSVAIALLGFLISLGGQPVLRSAILEES